MVFFRARSHHVASRALPERACVNLLLQGDQRVDHKQQIHPQDDEPKGVRKVNNAVEGCTDSNPDVSRT